VGFFFVLCLMYLYKPRVWLINVWSISIVYFFVHNIRLWRTNFCRSWCICFFGWASINLFDGSIFGCVWLINFIPCDFDWLMFSRFQFFHFASTPIFHKSILYHYRFDDFDWIFFEVHIDPSFSFIIFLSCWIDDFYQCLFGLVNFLAMLNFPIFVPFKYARFDWVGSFFGWLLLIHFFVQWSFLSNWILIY